MPITYSFDPSLRLIETVVLGKISSTDVRDHLERVQGEPWFPAPAMVDTRGASADMPSHEVRAIVDLLGNLASRLRATPIAVLVPSDIAYGLVRMISLLLEDRLSIMPFRDATHAMSWLQQGVHDTLPPVV